MKMNNQKIVAFLNLIIIKISAKSNYVSYDGYKVLELFPKSAEDVKLIYSLRRDSKYYGIEFWKIDKFVGSAARVMVPPSQEIEFIDDLKKNRIKFKTFIEDLGETFNYEKDQIRYYALNDVTSMGFKRYYRYREINKYLEHLGKTYPNKVIVENVGKSSEGRDIKSVTILPKTNSSNTRNTIFIDAAIHAREWITPATALYGIQQLVEGKHQGKYENMLDEVKWVFMPLVNPDGYEYSHQKDRMWRKTRRKAGMCVGVDGNRNYDFQWGATGASKNSCAQTYRGDEPFSEPETRAVRDVLDKLGDSCKMYLSLHSYGKYLLYPYGHTSKLPENWREQDDVARAGADAIRQFSGAKYKIGSSRNVLYAASGLSQDYAYEVKKIPISITMELPGGGRQGFDPPPTSIEKNVKETWEGIKSMAIRIVEKYSKNFKSNMKTKQILILLTVELLSLSLLTSAASIKSNIIGKTTYEGYKIYEVTPQTDSEVEALSKLDKNADNYGLDFFRHDKIPGHPAEVMVEPKSQSAFENFLQQNDIEFKVLVQNLQRTLEEQEIENNRPSFRRTITKRSGTLDLTRYYKYEEIIEYITNLEKQYPKNVQVFSGGKSYEDRDVPVVVVTNGDGNMQKETIVVDAGIHAREWIAPAEALYMLSQLVENATAHEDILKTLNWVIIPVVNPDGYAYTQIARMWRKTRKPSSERCIGTDANRNFGYEWGGLGASTDPCSDTFRGEQAFSEPEAVAVREVLKHFQTQAKFYLTLHSYGNYLLYPWGYTSDLPENWKEIDALAQVGAAAIRDATGTRYTVGSSTNVLYAAAGGSDDYALGELGIPFSITMELPRGGTGFDPPPSSIERLVTETWIGIEAMARYLAKYYSVRNITQHTDADVKILNEIKRKSVEYGLEFLRHDKNLGGPAEIMVEPSSQSAFERLLNKNKIKFEIRVNDLRKALNEQEIENTKQSLRRTLPIRSGSLDLTKYYKYEEILEYIKNLVKRFPKTVQTFSGGKSFEGRDIPVVVVSNGDKNKRKPTIFIDAGIHAREWIASAEALYILSQLVENCTKHQDVLKTLNWVILPNANPDGYVYTQIERMWRKTRKPLSDECIGTDPNRNFDFKWGGEDSNDDPCSESYRGIKPFSENETMVIRDVLKKFQNTTKFYLTLHSFGNLLIYPWGYTHDLPKNWKELDDLAQAGAKAIKDATGTSYTVGSSTRVLYSAPGGSDDYAMGALGIPFAITMELPAGGVTSFDPPPSSIEPLVTETWIGIKAMARHIIK
uniref:Zinc carboxypeptidase A 1 n=1 Tax=Culicoides sonorensis TaxID=179676 RepID=A0A336MC79_CULSO